jgi:hypothetical protein
MGLTAYEGGYSPDYDPSTAEVRAFRKASKFVAELEQLTLDIYNAFIALGGEFPSCLTFSGSYGAWSIHDPTIYASVTPQWDAIVRFNNPNTGRSAASLMLGLGVSVDPYAPRTPVDFRGDFRQAKGPADKEAARAIARAKNTSRKGKGAAVGEPAGIAAKDVPPQPAAAPAPAIAGVEDFAQVGEDAAIALAVAMLMID